MKKGKTIFWGTTGIIIWILIFNFQKTEGSFWFGFLIGAFTAIIIGGVILEAEK